MKNESTIKKIYDFVSILLTAIIAVSIIFTFAFKISAVNGSSMQNTLQDGNKVLITALDFKVKYGDIVIISQPNAYEEVLIKRVIATENQKIIIDSEKNTITVDGIVLDEPYIREKELNWQGDKTYPITVPKGKVFVMGDNRNYSADSRDNGVGMIDTRYIMGKAFYRIGDKALLKLEK
ncbi:MAG: signal peptidase I [Oscillospiraceae bacterium]